MNRHQRHEILIDKCNLENAITPATAATHLLNYLLFSRNQQHI